MNPLDRPVWSALNSLQTAFSAGDGRARRYQPRFNVFGSPRDDSPDAHAAFADLIAPGTKVAIAQVPEVIVPKGFTVVRAAMGVQMVATRRLWPEQAEVLTDHDAADMLALAKMTEPGPFAEQTHRLGRFIGIRSEGKLIAMAGERMRLPGYTEVSAVCTHPDHRGHGHARRLTIAASAHIQDRGETPFLHAWTTNRPAITLYETLGFVLRTQLHIVVLERDPGPA
jgi:predicted GNAT family acetyltransferase